MAVSPTLFLFISHIKEEFLSGRFVYKSWAILIHQWQNEYKYTMYVGCYMYVDRNNNGWTGLDSNVGILIVYET